LRGHDVGAADISAYALRQPDDINIPRAGARQLLAQAVEIEVETFLATVKDLKL